MCIKQHVDDELDKMKRFYHGLDDFLSQVALRIEIPFRAPSNFTFSIHYLPQLGFLIKTTRIDDTDLSGSTFEFIFTAQDSDYFKNQEMRDLDECALFWLTIGK